MSAKTVVGVVVTQKKKLRLKPRDTRHLSITSDKLRALLHEAWKNGNDSYLNHEDEDGTQQRYDYVDNVMVERGYKQVEA